MKKLKQQDKKGRCLIILTRDKTKAGLICLFEGYSVDEVTFTKDGYAQTDGRIHFCVIPKDYKNIFIGQLEKPARMPRKGSRRYIQQLIIED